MKLTTQKNEKKKQKKETEKEKSYGTTPHTVNL